MNGQPKEAAGKENYYEEDNDTGIDTINTTSLRGQIMGTLGIKSRDALNETIAAWANTHDGKVKADELIYAISLQAESIYEAVPVWGDFGKSFHHEMMECGKDRQAAALTDAADLMRRELAEASLIFEVGCAGYNDEGEAYSSVLISANRMDGIVRTVFEAARTGFTMQVIDGGVAAVKDMYGKFMVSCAYEAATIVELEAQMAASVASTGNEKDFQSIIMTRLVPGEHPTLKVAPKSVCRIVREGVLQALSEDKLVRFDRDELIHGLAALHKGQGNLSDEELLQAQRAFVARSLAYDLPPMWIGLSQANVADKAAALAGLLEIAPSHNSWDEAKEFVQRVFLSPDEKGKKLSQYSNILAELKQAAVSGELSVTEFAEKVAAAKRSLWTELPVLGHTDLAVDLQGLQSVIDAFNERVKKQAEKTCQGLLNGEGFDTVICWESKDDQQTDYVFRKEGKSVATINKASEGATLTMSYLAVDGIHGAGTGWRRVEMTLTPDMDFNNLKKVAESKIIRHTYETEDVTYGGGFGFDNMGGERRYIVDGVVVSIENAPCDSYGTTAEERKWARHAFTNFEYCKSSRSFLSEIESNWNEDVWAA